MNWACILLLWLVLVSAGGGAGVATGYPGDENPACDSPSQGLARSTAASDGTSLERASDGLNTALEKVGCTRRLP